MSLVSQIADVVTDIGTKFKADRATIGDLASLATTDKSSVVAAVNETFAAVGGGGATNLASTLSATQTVVTSDTGTDATIPAADTTNAGVMTKAMFDKLAAIEALADVTDATNVDAAGAVMNGDTSTAGMSFVIDEDSFATDSATKVPTQQSTKAYIATAVAAIVDSAPSALNTLDELAAALGDDANFAATTATSLGNRVRTDTAAQGLNGTQQSNARTNILVYSQAEIGDPTTDLAAVFAAALI